MASLIPGYEYDIFISYRQKDNKYDGWVTEFVDNLKRELEATFKEEVSVYFDINPHDGLLETHDVDASLKEKLKCLIFIPIISRTYCDPKSFAWEHEFVAFVEQASKDQFGLKVKLPNGNVANRVLPVRIHDLELVDIKLCESVLGGILRGVEFIYKEPGVNKPLTSEDDEKKNLNKTKYRIQINKIANAIKEIISGLMAGEVVSGKENAENKLPWEEAKKEKETVIAKKPVGLKRNKLASYIISAVFVLVLIGVYAYPKIFKANTLEKPNSSGSNVSIAIIPFQNLTNDTTWNVWKVGIEMGLINTLSNTGELIVKQKDAVNTLLQTKGLTEYSSISSEIAGTISKNLDADIYIYGGIQKAGSLIRVNAQLIDTKTKDVLKTFEINWTYNERKIFALADSLRKEVTDYLILSKLIKENIPYLDYPFTTTSPDAFRYSIYASKAFVKFDLQTGIDWSLKALAVDSNYFESMMELSSAYSNMGMQDQNLYWVLKYYNKRDLWPHYQQIMACWAYASNFESPAEAIKYLKQLKEIDGQPSYLLGLTFLHTKQYDKAIDELEKVLDLDHKWGLLKNQWDYIQLAKAYYYAGQFKKEKKLFKEVENVNEDHESRYFLPIIWQQILLSMAEKDTAETNRYIKKYITLEKELSLPEADYTADLGMMNATAGYLDKAEEYLRKALSIEPENPVYLKKLADFFIDNNRKLNDVPELMDKAMKQAKNRTDYYTFMDTKGWAYYKMGKNKEALSILQKVWDEAPYKIYVLRSHYEEVKKAVASQK